MALFVSVHYSLDIGTKGGNRAWFERLVRRDVERALRPLKPVKVTSHNSRLLVELPEGTSQERARELLSRCFGVSWFSFCYPCQPTEDSIAETLIKNHPWKEKPALVWVRVNRADKRFPIKSPELGLSLARRLAKELGCDAHSSAGAQAKVEITNGQTLVSFDKIVGLGGLPNGSEGKVAVLLSGGIDSPVAAWMLARRGCEPVMVHFYPFRETEAKEKLGKIRELCGVVSRYTPLTLYAVPYYPFLSASLGLNEKTVLLAFRRFMLRVADAIADREGALALGTGESLGQVASQTLSNMASVDAAARRPVLRPLVGMDKQQIIDLAAKVGTYDISIGDYVDCCQSLVSRYPAIKSTPEQLSEDESNLDIGALINESLRLALVERFPVQGPTKQH